MSYWNEEYPGNEEYYQERIENILESFENDSVRFEHMNKLVEAFYNNFQRNDVEYGGWGLDDKRPFGNSSVVFDIAEIVDIELPEYEDKNSFREVERYLNGLYDDLGYYLKYLWLDYKQTLLFTVNNIKGDDVQQEKVE